MKFILVRCIIIIIIINIYEIAAINSISITPVALMNKKIF